LGHGDEVVTIYRAANFEAVTEQSMGWSVQGQKDDHRESFAEELGGQGRFITEAPFADQRKRRTHQHDNVLANERKNVHTGREQSSLS